MNGSAVFAKIYWRLPEEGGRKLPPSGPKYSTVAIFSQLPGYSTQGWSVVIQFQGKIELGSYGIAQIWFLASDAPGNLLSIGNTFQLTEGRHIVASGEIINPHAL